MNLRKFIRYKLGPGEDMKFWCEERSLKDIFSKIFSLVVVKGSNSEQF